MARLALFLVLCGAWGVLRASAEEKGHKENSEITDYEKAVEATKRTRRDVVPNRDSSIFIRSEKKTTDEHIIWQDNSETRKQGHVPTVTKVLHHGIYPSLNVTVPVNSSYVNRYRQKRSEGGEKYIGHTVRTKRQWQNEMESNDLKASTRWQQPTRAVRTTSQDLSETPTGGHYQRADRLPGAYQPFDPPAQRSRGYRTMYLPNTEYRGDPENKGRVKMISAAYYSINESTADLRSYRNPAVHRRPRRTKRNTHWAWLDRVLKSICILKNPDVDQSNDIPGSEPLKLEVSEANEEAQNVYGYSSNGHPHNVDRIYLVPNDIHTPNQPITSTNHNPPTILDSFKPHHEIPSTLALEQPKETSPSPLDPQSEEMSSSMDQSDSQSEGIPSSPLDLPKEATNLIQVPERRLACSPPKRYARGRCRTVWRS